jgi:two-component system sensor kinase FixL
MAPVLDAANALPLAALILMAGTTSYFAWLIWNLRRSNAVLEKLVAERVETDAQSAQSEERLRKIIETEPECVKIQARDGTILEMNPAGLKLVDARRPEEIFGESVYRLVAPEFRQAYEALTERVFEGGTDILEFQIVSLKNRRLWMETHAAPLTDANGNVVALLAITREIGARKLYERQLRRESRQLAHASRLDTMGQMATMLAHELNQPLTAIVNYSRGTLLRLRSNEMAPDVVRAMELVCGEAERAANIIRSLRSYMSKENNEHNALALNSVIERALSFAELEARAQNIRIAKQFADDIPQVTGDATQLEQVVLNIVRNGIEAMEDQPICDRLLSINTLIAPNGMARVRIKDTGIGQDSDDLETMFNPFFTTKSDGMGMGLCISRSIVEAHGGRLTASANAPEPGLTFMFDLPPAEERRLQ